MEHWIEIASARIVTDETAIFVQRRPLEVALALAACGGTLSGECLADMLYPDVEGAAAADRLRVNAHRLRAQIPGLLATTRGAYALAHACNIDLVEIEALLKESERSCPEKLHRLLRHMAALCSPHARAVANNWHWFASVEARIGALRSDVAFHCSAHITTADLAAHGLAVARTSLYEDPCDEGACALAVRALHVLGRSNEAQTVFNQYKNALHAEYHAEPSHQLRQLSELAV